MAKIINDSPRKVINDRPRKGEVVASVYQAYLSKALKEPKNARAIESYYGTKDPQTIQHKRPYNMKELKNVTK